MNWQGQSKWLAGLLLVAAVVAGCNHGPKMAPVTGKVLYNGKPLTFGVITFQPPSGQPAQGDIQSDGAFTLSTYKLSQWNRVMSQILPTVQILYDAAISADIARRF